MTFSLLTYGLLSSKKPWMAVRSHLRFPSTICHCNPKQTPPSFVGSFGSGSKGNGWSHCFHMGHRSQSCHFQVRFHTILPCYGEPHWCPPVSISTVVSGYCSKLPAFPTFQSSHIRQQGKQTSLYFGYFCKEYWLFCNLDGRLSTFPCIFGFSRCYVLFRNLIIWEYFL